MNERDDLSRALPEPPPPRPAARRAAIDRAMARFDGREAPQAAPVALSLRRSRWPQLSAAMAMALVGVLSVSLWRSGDYHKAPLSPEPAPAVIESAAPASPQRLREVPSVSPTVAPSMRAATPPAPIAPDAERAASPAKAPVAESISRVPGASYAPEPSAPPPPPPPPAPAPAPAAPPRTGVDSIVADDVGSFPDRGEKAVVVTGTRAQESARMRARPDKPAAKAVDAARRGDWNACTIEDPARSLQACRATIDPAAPGDRGRADARIADGLDRAWAGDMRGAVAAFDRAIDLTERSPSAYLNRGLARERSGDRRGALSDLDKAVRLSPESARGYYLRSLVRDRNGDRSGARADAERAIALDPAYEAVVRY